MFYLFAMLLLFCIIKKENMKMGKANKSFLYFFLYRNYIVINNERKKIFFVHILNEYLKEKQ